MESQQVEDLLGDLSRRGPLAFSAYRNELVVRLIDARMNDLGIGDLAAYRAYLEACPPEVRRLARSLLVRRTEFLRDLEVWTWLSREIATAVVRAKAAERRVRAWSAGCATGEEAYTLAMLISDALAGHGDVGVTVFATDADGPSIAAAQVGRYTTRQVERVPPDWRARYFRRVGNDWIVTRELRSRVVFTRHDLLRDPVLGHLDVITCRNTLLYFKPQATSAALARFYLGLERGGVILLGRSERLPRWCDLFASIPDCFCGGRPIAGRAVQAMAAGLSRPWPPHRSSRYRALSGMAR